MLLYEFPLSINVHKAKLVLEECGVKYTTKSINILKGDNANPDFLKISPGGTLPVLVDGEKVFRDSKSIAEYVNSIGKPLGGDAVDSAKVDEWLTKSNHWEDTPYTFAHGNLKQSLQISQFRIKVAEARLKEHPEMADIYNKRLEVMRETEKNFQDKDYVAKLDAELINLLDDAEKQLSTTKWLAGSEYSLADAFFTAVLARVEFVKVHVPLMNEKPHVKEFFGAVKARPSYKHVIGKYEGLGALPIVIPLVFALQVRSLFKAY
eukprot:SM000188S03843  [mRNA]  locus=s188:233901:235887:- [translate_table: standard]